MAQPRPSPTDRLLHDFLGRVRSQLPVGSDDVVRELESSIMDRTDELAAAGDGVVDPGVLGRVLDEMGDPEAIAAAYAPRGNVVAPEHYRAFLVGAAITFAVHLVLIGVATTAERALQFGPLAVSPVGPHGLLSVAAAAFHALLLDVGLMVVTFAAAPWIHRVVKLRTATFGVDAAPRSAGGRAVLSVLVAAILGLFRDRLFVVMDGPNAHPLFTPWFVAVLPLVLAVLAFAIVVDLLYLFLGERRTTLAMDALHGAATLAVMILLARGDALLEVPPVASFDTFRAPINGFLDDLGTLVVLAVATLAAVKTVRRLVRCSQV